jgi:hypothetical protein
LFASNGVPACNTKPPFPAADARDHPVAASEQIGGRKSAVFGD